MREIVTRRDFPCNKGEGFLYREEDTPTYYYSFPGCIPYDYDKTVSACWWCEHVDKCKRKEDNQ
jgi:hypothetical protein